MRLIAGLPAALVTLLLATSAVGRATHFDDENQIVFSTDDSAPIEAYGPALLGPDPGKNKKRAEYFKWCGKPHVIKKPTPKPAPVKPAPGKPPAKPPVKPPPKKGKGKNVITVEDDGNEVIVHVSHAAQDDSDSIPDNDSISATAIVDVRPGTFGQAKGPTDGVRSGSFGTCVGFAVKGTAGTAGASDMFILHMLTDNWQHMREQYNAFANAVDLSNLSGKQGVMYTVDTRASNTELEDVDVAAEASAAESDYARLFNTFQLLVPGARRKYHGYASAGTLTVQGGASGIVASPDT